MISYRAYYFESGEPIEVLHFPEDFSEAESRLYAKEYADKKAWAYRLVRVIESEEVLATTEN